MKKYDTYIAVTGQARNIKPTTIKDAVMLIEQTSVTMHGVTPLRLGRTIYGVGGSILCCLMNLVFSAAVMSPWSSSGILRFIFSFFVALGLRREGFYVQVGYVL